MQKNINYQWTECMIEEWSRLGVGFAIISPGSRSTPLALAAIANKGLEHLVHFDERGAGFLALGWAKASGKPALLICTSGTALSHYYPAVIEAKRSQVPMIIMSADRPPELQNIEANQTIDQIKIYGNAINYSYSFPCPSIEVPLTYILSQIDQAYYKSVGDRSLNAGPIHLNCPFRELLSQKEYPILEDRIKKWREIKKPYLNIGSVVSEVSTYENDHLSKLLNKVQNPLIILGDLKLTEQDKLKKALKRLKGRVAIYSETVLLEDQNHSYSFLLECLDLWIKHSSHWKDPDLIIHFGGKIVSKTLGKYLSSYQGLYLQVGLEAYEHDPYLLGGYRIVHAPSSVMDFFANFYNESWQKYGQKLEDQDKKVREKCQNYFKKEESLIEGPLWAEGFLFHYLSRKKYFLKKNYLLYLGNSLPVRDFISYANKRGIAKVLVNRGASGIDGQLASAFGSASYLKMPTIIVIGDLSTLHDLNSLYLFSKLKTPVLIVVVNNNGGGIFHHLPIYGKTPYFEEALRTPHFMNFAHIAKQFSIPYSSAKGVKNLDEAFDMPNTGACLLEVIIDPLDNLKMKREIINLIKNETFS